VRGRHLLQRRPHVLHGQLLQRNPPDNVSNGRSESRFRLDRLGGTPGQPFVEPVGHGLLHRVTLGGPQAGIQLRVQRLSLSLTSVRVWPLTFLRTHFPSAPKPSETTPRQRPEQVL